MQCVIDCRKRGNVQWSLYGNFLQFLLQNSMRFGFADFLILKAKDQALMSLEILKHPDLKANSLEILGMKADLPLPQALLQCSELLNSTFLFMDGSACLDFNWLDLFGRYEKSGKMQLAFQNDAGSGVGKWASLALLEKEFLNAFKDFADADCKSWLEILMRSNRTQQAVYSGSLLTPYNFQDEGLPRRGAVFLDRDGVLNRDLGYVHSYEEWEWISGIREAIKFWNDQKFYVFVVTNQSGIARGYYKEADVFKLHAQIQEDLRGIGAHIDAFRFCPFHPEGSVQAYRKKSDWRKPGTGMLEDLFSCWPIDKNKSFLIGDRESDIETAKAYNLPAYLFTDKRFDLKACGENIKFFQ